MSFQYDDYLKGHISAVQKAADWIVLHCQDVMPNILARIKVELDKEEAIQGRL